MLHNKNAKAETLSHIDARLRSLPNFILELKQASDE